MEEFSKTPAVHLIGLWINLNRPQTQWSVEGRPGEWKPTTGYKSCIKNIEAAISKKLQITLLETCILLKCKKTCTDAQENGFFNTKKNVFVLLRPLNKKKWKTLNTILIVKSYNSMKEK